MDEMRMVTFCRGFALFSDTILKVCFLCVKGVAQSVLTGVAIQGTIDKKTSAAGSVTAVQMQYRSALSYFEQVSRLVIKLVPSKPFYIYYPHKKMVLVLGVWTFRQFRIKHLLIV